MDGEILSGERRLGRAELIGSRGAGRERLRRTRHRREQRRRHGAAQRLRVFRGGDRSGADRRLRGAGELAFHGRGGGLHPAGLRRPRAGRARGPRARHRRRHSRGPRRCSWSRPRPKSPAPTASIRRDVRCRIRCRPAGRTGTLGWRDRTPGPSRAKPSRSNMIYTSGTTGRPKGVRRQPASPEKQQTTDHDDRDRVSECAPAKPSARSSPARSITRPRTPMP